MVVQRACLPRPPLALRRRCGRGCPHHRYVRPPVAKPLGCCVHRAGDVTGACEGGADVLGDVNGLPVADRSYTAHRRQLLTRRKPGRLAARLVRQLAALGRTRHTPTWAREPTTAGVKVSGSYFAHGDTNPGSGLLPGWVGWGSCVSVCSPAVAIALG